MLLLWDDHVSIMLRAGKTAAWLFNGTTKAPLNKPKRNLSRQNKLAHTSLNFCSLQHLDIQSVAISNLVEIALKDDKFCKYKEISSAGRKDEIISVCCQ